MHPKDKYCNLFNLVLFQICMTSSSVKLFMKNFLGDFFYLMKVNEHWGHQAPKCYKKNHKTIIKVVHILYSNSSKVEECEEQTENLIIIIFYKFSLCSMA